MIDNGFNGMIDSAFNIFNVNQYNTGVLYNDKLYEKGEQFMEVNDSQSPEGTTKVEEGDVADGETLDEFLEMKAQNVVKKFGINGND